MRHVHGTPQLLLQDGDGRRGRFSRFTWTCARTEGDDVLLLSFTGSPLGFPRDAPPLYDAAARLVDDVVVVGVTPSPALRPQLLRGRAVGRTGLLRVQVEGGVRGRTVLDGADGRQRPVFDGSRLLTAGAPAPGYTTAVVGERGHVPATWMQSFGSAGSDGLLLLAHAAQEDPLPSSYAEVEVEVRGRRGVLTQQREGRRVESRAVHWHERGGTVVVTSGRGSSGSGVLTAEQLVAFADALR